MTSHPGIDLITFTGSTETGKKVVNSSAPTLKHVSLELGGNDPGIVLSDANPQQIARALFDSMFLLSGQGCICAIVMTGTAKTTLRPVLHFSSKAPQQFLSRAHIRELLP